MSRVQQAFCRVVRLALIGLAPVLFTPVFAAGDDSVWAGTYRDDRITIHISPPGLVDLQDSHTGEIEMGEQKFPLKGRLKEGHLQGTFESQGDEFEFIGVLNGRMLVFTTGGTTYRLRKQGENPLARRPATPNPLARARPSPAPPSSTVGSPEATPAAPKTAGLRFKRQSVLDHPSMIGGEAFTVLVPADWQLEGGVAWRMHPAVPAHLSFRTADPAGIERLEVLPAIPFVWMEGGIPLFPAGSHYWGNEVAEPIEDPVVYLKEVILPRFRRNLLAPQVVRAEQLPKVAAFMAGNAQEPGVQRTFRAVRVRLEYQENGKVLQEDFYCILASAYVPSMRMTFWGPDRNYAIRAEKGKLESRTAIFQAVLSSLTPNLAWFNRYHQLVQVLIQGQLDCTRPVAELARYIAATSDEVTDSRRQIYARQQSSQEQLNRWLGQSILGLAEYRDPIEPRILQLPSGYPAVWANAAGEYILSPNRDFDPNTGSSTGWRRAELAETDR